MYCTMAVAFFSVAKICHFVVVLFRLFLVVQCERYHKKKTAQSGWLATNVMMWENETSH